MNNPGVSAIITTHNRKKLVRKAIISCLRQSYSNIECIVVDDASTDNTEEYLKKYIDKGKIKYYYIPEYESRGGNYARNYGIRVSSGDYLAFLDDDDEWLPEKISKQVKAMQSSSDVGFVYCGRIYENNFDPKTRRGLDINNAKYKEGDLSKESLIHIITSTSCLTIKREVVDLAGMFDTNLNFWQEYEFCIRALQITKARCVRENLVLYRVLANDKNRLSNKLNGWEEAVCYIEKKHKSLFGTLSPHEEALRQVYKSIDGYNRAKREGKHFHMLKYIMNVLSNPERTRIVVQKLLRRF